MGWPELPCLAQKKLHCVVQIMMLLTSSHARPDIPEYDSLPGLAWPGTTAFIQLMQASCMHALDSQAADCLAERFASVPSIHLRPIHFLAKHGTFAWSNQCVASRL